MKRIISMIIALGWAVNGFSQEVEMADSMRANGKIYVVVAILVIILAGLVTYLILLDRKVGRLEKKLDENRPS